jgi:hypothetical protein
VIDTDLRDDLLDRLRDFPAGLRAAIDGVDDVLLTRAGPGGGWGAVEIFCHLRDWDEIYAVRIERILATDAPAIAAVDDDLWPIQRDYHRQDPHAVLAEFSKRRGALASRLDPLDPAQWQRLGIHFEHGRRSLHWFAERIALHDADHATQLRDTLA